MFYQPTVSGFLCLPIANVRVAEVAGQDQQEFGVQSNRTHAQINLKTSRPRISDFPTGCQDFNLYKDLEDN